MNIKDKGQVALERYWRVRNYFITIRTGQMKYEKHVPDKSKDLTKLPHKFTRGKLSVKL